MASPRVYALGVTRTRTIYFPRTTIRSSMELSSSGPTLRRRVLPGVMDRMELAVLPTQPAAGAAMTRPDGSRPTVLEMSISLTPLGGQVMSTLTAYLDDNPKGTVPFLPSLDVGELNDLASES